MYNEGRLVWHPFAVASSTLPAVEGPRPPRQVSLFALFLESHAYTRVLCNILCSRAQSQAPSQGVLVLGQIRARAN